MSTNDPNHDLSHACRHLEVADAQRALERGALVDGVGPEEPSPLLQVILAEDGTVECLTRKNELIALLFDAGATRDPYWVADEDLGQQAGLEILFDQSMRRCGEPGWSEAPELALLDTWLASGNAPEPDVTVDGRIRPFLNMLGAQTQNMREGGGDPEATQREIDFIRKTAALMALHGCVLSPMRLDAVGFELDDHDIIQGYRLAMRAERERAALEAQTTAAARTGKPSPRL